MNASALTPYGHAVRDYHGGRHDAELTLHSSLGEYDTMPLAWFFRNEDEFFPFDHAAIEMCRGRVLDAGAGTGVHSLCLQERGLEVVAVDTVPECVDVMKARGVNDVRLADMFALSGEKFDTVLMLMNGIGPVGTLDNLESFLAAMRPLITHGGQLLLDSSGVDPQTPPANAPTPPWPQTPPDYIGDVWIQLSYDGVAGESFRELYCAFGMLGRIAKKSGWDCQMVYQDEDTAYVARLLPPRS